MACLGGSNDSSVRLLRAQILNQILHQIVCEQAKGKKKIKRNSLYVQNHVKNSGKSSLEATKVCKLRSTSVSIFTFPGSPGSETMKNDGEKGANRTQSLHTLQKV